MSEAPQIPESKLRTAGRGGALKTGAIWMLLVLMFVSIYSMEQDGSGPGGTLVLVGFAGLMLVLVLVFWWLGYRNLRRFFADHNEGVAMLSRGELERARGLFWRWAESTNNRFAAALARHSLAWTLMRQGQLEQARAVWTDNDEKYRVGLKRLHMYATSAADLALCHALLDDVEQAETWLAHAEERRSEPSTPSFPAMKTFALAAVHCRANRSSEAARLLSDRWAECEALFTGETLRPLRVLRAYAEAAAGPRNAGVAESLLATSRPAYAGEYDFLGAAWPEMAAFLASHQLTTTSVPVST